MGVPGDEDYFEGPPAEPGQANLKRGCSRPFETRVRQGTGLKALHTQRRQSQKKVEGQEGSLVPELAEGQEGSRQEGSPGRYLSSHRARPRAEGGGLRREAGVRLPQEGFSTPLRSRLSLKWLELLIAI